MSDQKVTFKKSEGNRVLTIIVVAVTVLLGLGVIFLVVIFFIAAFAFRTAFPNSQSVTPDKVYSMPCTYMDGKISKTGIKANDGTCHSADEGLPCTYKENGLTKTGITDIKGACQPVLTQ